MATLPADNYVNQDARTVAEMKTALESMRDVVAEIGATAPETISISSAGAAGSQPTAPYVKLKSYSYETPAADDLETVPFATLDEGRTVVFTNFGTAANVAVTVKHSASGTSQTIQTADSADFVLQGTAKIALQKQGLVWVEIWRQYGDQSATERSDLGLQDAAQRAVNTLAGNVGMTGTVPIFGGPISSGAPLALNSSGQIVQGTADDGNAATLDNLDSTDFVRSTSTSAQSMLANLALSTAAATTLSLNSTDGAALPGVEFKASGTERASLRMNTSNGMAELGTKDSGGTQDASIRLNQSNSRLEHYHKDGSLQGTWTSLRPGPGNGLDADSLGGNTLADLIQAGWDYNGETTGWPLHQNTQGYIVFDTNGLTGVHSSNSNATKIGMCWGGDYSVETVTIPGTSTTRSVGRFDFPITFLSNPYIIHQTGSTLGFGAAAGHAFWPLGTWNTDDSTTYDYSTTYIRFQFIQDAGGGNGAIPPHFIALGPVLSVP